MNTDSQIIDQTKTWIESIVVGCNFCPFAWSELKNDTIRYRVDRGLVIDSCLRSLIEECELLESDKDIETTLIVYTDTMTDFQDYLEFVDLSESILITQGYEGVFQVASFHPDYRFAGSSQDDPANFTNRSLYPMLHIIRESSIEKVLKSYRSPENIPARNIQFAREQGSGKMVEMLRACYNQTK